MNNWPPFFTFCLPFAGCFCGLLFYLQTGLLADTVWLLKGLLLGLCAGLVLDVGVALCDWFLGDSPAKQDTQSPTKVKHKEQQ